MWDNVGEMPLEIFGDYLTDILNEEWSWEYLALTFNFNGTPGSTFGTGDSLNNGSGFYYGFSFNDSVFEWTALGFGRMIVNSGDGYYNVGGGGTGIDFFWRWIL